jgi:hypothetical protein
VNDAPRDLVSSPGFSVNPGSNGSYPRRVRSSLLFRQRAAKRNENDESPEFRWIAGPFTLALGIFVVALPARAEAQIFDSENIAASSP